MTPLPDDINVTIRSIIEATIQELVDLGMERRGAIQLLCVQSIIRLDDRADRAVLVDLLGYDVHEAPIDGVMH
jgi:hypothetical protein